VVACARTTPTQRSAAMVRSRHREWELPSKSQPKNVTKPINE
jgi:hypothetical protein